MAGSFKPNVLPIEEARALIRLMHSSNTIEGSGPGLDLRRKIAVELRLLATSSKDTFSVLADVLEQGRVWSTSGWPLVSNVGTQIRQLLTDSLLPNASCQRGAAPSVDPRSLFALAAS